MENKESKKQVFSGAHPRNWKLIKLLFFSASFTLAILIGIAVFAVLDDEKVKVPFSLADRSFVHLNAIELSDTVQKEVQVQFTKDIASIRKQRHPHYYEPKPLPSPDSVQLKLKFPIRAGFFVNWDPQSFYSIRDHAKDMNLVLPEWFFVQDSSDEVYVDMTGDALNALKIIRQQHLPAVVMISNYFSNKWNGSNVHRIIHDQTRRSRFIQSVLVALKKYGLQGVNIDFEELEETSDETLITFQKELYTALHKQGFLVTQEVSPFNEDYNYKELSKYNDYLFLMAYDLHNATSVPGQIAPIQWVENALDEAGKYIDQSKIILDIAAYGYDWPVGYQGQDITFQQAITIARESDTVPQFDNNTYNLSYKYWDDQEKEHIVFFTDALTAFNTMRTAEDFGTAGVAIWRLGSEDSRLWSFFPRSLALDSLRRYPLPLESLKFSLVGDNIDYFGQGEVLNIVSEPVAGKMDLEMDSRDMLLSEENFRALPEGFVVNRTGEADHKIVLTFDDGPDETYTSQILDIIQKYKVPAAFFVTGSNSQAAYPMLQRLYKEGYEIGNHTFTHVNMELCSDERSLLELRTTRRIIEAITGHSTILFRPPYNADAEPNSGSELHPLMIAKKDGYICIGSAIDPRDWEKGISADSIVRRAIEQRDLGHIILLHDAGGDRTETIKALPRIIEYYQQHGYQFITLSELMGKKRDLLMPAITGEENNLLLMANEWLVVFAYWQEHFLFGLFLVALILSLFRILLLAVLAIQKKINERLSDTQLDAIGMEGAPLVSIIVPAYNEEVNVCKTIHQLLQSAYPNIEIILMDDGSKDQTFNKVQETFSDEPRVIARTKPNGGKATAINEGIRIANGEFLLCIDADTQISVNAIQEILPLFADPKMAAVAGSVRVGNKRNLLTRWQDIEYTTSQNFDRLAFDELNAIMVVPGAIGMFRKSAVIEVGVFTTDTVAEDCDITMRLLDAGYKVKTCNAALAFTEAPESIKDFMKQRRRWTFGIMQSFWKHKRQLLSIKKPNLGFALLPNILIYQMLLPLFAPLVDLALIIALLFGKTTETLLLYLLYMLMDVLISWLAFYFDKRRFGVMDFLVLIPQRILYRQLLFVVLIESYIKAIKGELQHWGVLTRTGNVKP